MENNKTHEEENWEAQEHNQEFRKAAKDDEKVDLVKKSDLVNKLKYDHIENTISLIDKLRLALRELSKNAN